MKRSCYPFYTSCLQLRRHLPSDTSPTKNIQTTTARLLPRLCITLWVAAQLQQRPLMGHHFYLSAHLQRPSHPSMTMR